MTRRTHGIPFMVLAGGLLLQGFLVGRMEPGRPTGDEQYFLTRAEYLSLTHRFAPLPDTASDRLPEPSSYNSDWRPPGYVAVLALVGGPEPQWEKLWKRMAWLQWAIGESLIVVSFCLLWPLVRGNAGRAGLAAVLSLQPWSLAFATSTIADSLNASFGGAGFLALCFYLNATEPRSRQRWMIAGAGLWSLGILFRPDTLALVPIGVGAALFLGGDLRKPSRLFSAMACILVVLGLQIGYRWSVSRQPGIFGSAHFFDEGAFEWVHTWYGTEKQAYDGFAYKLAGAEAALSDLPAKAFDNEGERRIVGGALKQVRDQGRYSASVDRLFAHLAEKRAHANFLRCVVGTAFWRSAGMWLNLDTNSQLLEALKSIPGSVRRSVLGFLVTLKIAIFLLAATEVGAISWRFCRGILTGVDDYSMLAAVVIISRTVLFGFVLKYSTNRYMLAAWIPLLVLSAVGGERLRRAFAGGSRDGRSWIQSWLREDLRTSVANGKARLPPSRLEPGTAN